MKRMLCPYCFEFFLSHETPFRCINQQSRCAPKIDDVLREKWGEGTPVNKWFKSKYPVIFKRELKCPDCMMTTPKRLCPNCHMVIPRTLFEYKSLTLALIGAKDSGKSHYITVLIDQLMKKIGPSMNMLVEMLNDETIYRYREEYHNPIFKKNQILDATHSAEIQTSVKKPLLFSLTLYKKGWFGGTKITRVIVLAFYDTAGEDMKSQDTMSRVNKYIYRSDGIVLLFDPLQLQFIRENLKGKIALPAMTTETSDIITRTCDLIRTGRRMKADRKISSPIAVSFSKLDAVQGLLNRQYQINSPAEHAIRFNRTDFNAVNSEMESLLAEWDGEYVIQQVMTRFKTYAFFGLSALGCQPVGTSIQRVTPHRVADPILWLLYRNKVIKSQK